MNFKFERILLICLAAFFLFGWIRSCTSGKGNCIGDVTIKTITKYDTIPGASVVSYTPVPVPVYIHDTTQGETQFVTLPGEYFPPAISPVPIAINHYADTLKFDTLGYAIVRDTVAGKILKRGFDFNIIRPTITVTRTVIPDKHNKVYLGFEYQYPINYIGGGLAFQFKNDNFLKASYGIANKTQQFGLSYFTKIKFK